VGRTCGLNTGGGGGEGFTGFRFGGLKIRDHWVDLGVGERIILS
jgi:hypothetical protein